MNWSRLAIDMAFVLGGVAVGYLWGTAAGARRDRARAARAQVEAVMDAVFGPPHRGVYREPPS